MRLLWNQAKVYRKLNLAMIAFSLHASRTVVLSRPYHHLHHMLSTVSMCMYKNVCILQELELHILPFVPSADHRNLSNSWVELQMEMRKSSKALHSTSHWRDLLCLVLWTSLTRGSGQSVPAVQTSTSPGGKYNYLFSVFMSVNMN